jgi:hypothetical protein
MNWDAVGAIAELLGAGGVVLTLVYLAAQIRRSNALALAESHRHSYLAIAPSQLVIADNAGLAATFRSGLADRGSLSADERVRFDLLLSHMIGALSSSVTDKIALNIESGDLISDHKASLRMLLASPGGSEWWGIYREQFPPAFQRAVAEEGLASTAA